MDTRGVGADSLSATECIDAGLPIMHLLGYPDLSGSGDNNAGGERCHVPGWQRLDRAAAGSCLDPCSGAGQ